MSHFGWLVRTFCLLWLVLTSVGCEKRLASPQLADPIYRQIARTLQQQREAVKDEQVKLLSLKEELKNADMRSIDAKIIKADIRKSIENLARYEQLVKYYEIRERRRKIEAAISYELALRENRHWPDPEEYRHYQMNKKLAEAPRSWQSRVPQLFHASPNLGRQPAQK